MTISTLTPAAGQAEGERRRDAALQLLRDRRAALIRRIQCAYLALLLHRGPSTIDPVRAAVPIPEGTDPRLVGAAVRQLAKMELIYRTGLSRSVRPEAHGRHLPRWSITDGLPFLRGSPRIPNCRTLIPSSAPSGTDVPLTQRAGA